MTYRDWIEAARPRTLPAAVAPVVVGGGIATGDGVFRWIPFLATLAAALAIQVAANFANDVSDASRGADPEDRVGPRRMVATGAISARAMWVGVAIALAIAVIAGTYLITIAGWVVAVIGIASIAALLTYVGGPAPYGYRGFGEVMVFVFFGLIATVGTRFIFDRTTPLDAWLLGAVMGLFATAILLVNNLRDIETDARAGKRTLAVIIGSRHSRNLYSVLIGAGFGLVLIGAVIGIAAPLTGLAVLAAPMAGPLLRRVRVSQDPENLVLALVGTARLQLVVAVALAAGAAVN